MLEAIADDVFLWRQSGTFGHPNAGIVVDDDGLTVVDALTTPAQARPLADDLAMTGLPVRRLVLTSSHIEYVGGSTAFPLAAVYARAQVSAHLEQPPNVEGYKALLPELAADFDDLETRRVTHVVTEAAWLSAKAIAVPTSGQLDQNLVVQVPHANVVFAGAMCRFGATPLAFDGDPLVWAESLRSLESLGTHIVPGHGPMGDHGSLGELASYFDAVCSVGPGQELPGGAWDEWSDRDFDVINVERAQMLLGGDEGPPPSLLRRLGR